MPGFGNYNIMKNKTITILNPYLDTLGGGERYILTIAEVLSRDNSVIVYWDDLSIKEKIENRLHIDTQNIQFKKIIKNKIERFLAYSNSDILFYITDGSLFFSPAKKSILIIQSPSHIPKIQTKFDRLKLKTWNSIFCYSKYIQSFIKKKINKDIVIFPPSIDYSFYSSKQKENIILSTGRFFSHLHSKKQHLLVEAFKDLYTNEDVSSWKLVLIGSTEHEESNEYLQQIKTNATGYPIEIHTNIPFSTLKDYYAKAKLFWLATGLGEDLIKYPERAEHFGIATLEAMASGCVPIVYNGGGQKELVRSGIDGYLFEDKNELIRYTKEMIDHADKRKKIAEHAIRTSKKYSLENFRNKLHEILK